MTDATAALRGSDTRVAFTCALAAAGSAVLTCLASQDGWFRPSALLKITPTDALAPLARAGDPDFVFANPADHYDGGYYYAIAHDPLALGDAHRFIDQGAYRYGHPLYGWLADALSLGRPIAIPSALLVISLLGLALAGWALSRLAVGLGASPWLGLAVAVSPGLLSAGSVMTPEPVCAGLAVSGLLAWQSGRWRLAALPIGLVCLAKEQFVSLAVGLAVWEVVGAVRSKERVDALVTKVIALAWGPVALALWYVYVHARFGRWSFDYETGNLGKPLAGWLETFHVAHDFTVGGSFQQVQIGAIAPPILIATGVLFAIAAVRAVYVRTVLDVPLLIMIAIVLCQGWRTLLFAHELLRTPAVPALLAVVVVVARRTPQVAT
jgi:hypothetical protein